MNDESDEFGDTLQSGEGVQPEDTEDAEHVDHEVPSASGFGGSDEIDDSDDRSLTDDRGASGGAEQSEDRVDTGDSEDSEDGSASAELSSGLHSTAVRKDGPEVCTAGGCPDCGSELGHATGKCLVCILERARAVTAS